MKCCVGSRGGDHSRLEDGAVATAHCQSCGNMPSAVLNIEGDATFCELCAQLMASDSRVPIALCRVTESFEFERMDMTASLVPRRRDLQRNSFTFSSSSKLSLSESREEEESEMKVRRWLTVNEPGNEKKRKTEAAQQVDSSERERIQVNSIIAMQ